VIVPSDWNEIERVLFERYIPVERNWQIGESIDDLLAENLILGYPIPEGMSERAEDALRAYRVKQGESLSLVPDIAAVPEPAMPTLPDDPSSVSDNAVIAE
jgi:hypothetical protein